MAPAAGSAGRPLVGSFLNGVAMHGTPRAALKQVGAVLSAWVPTPIGEPSYRSTVYQAVEGSILGSDAISMMFTAAQVAPINLA